MISLIAAMAKDRVIGKDNQLPWRLPEDLAYFKRTTMGKPIVMGRKTFDSIGRPLPGRLNIVMTRQTDWSHEGVTVAHDQAAVELAIVEQAIHENNQDTQEIIIAGGEAIYRHWLPLADRLYLTQIDLDIAGDAHFPEFDLAEWECVTTESGIGQKADPLRYEHLTYDRIRL